MRYLKAGEIVRDTDQLCVVGFGWVCGSLNVGKRLPADKVGLYRRPESRDLKPKKRPVRRTRSNKSPCHRLSQCPHALVDYCGKKKRYSRLGCYKPSTRAAVRGTV
jgi:hypothetical protein